MKDKAYLYYIYCKVKDRIQREKQVIQSDQDVHVYGLWWMRWKLLFVWSLSLKILLRAWLSVFFFFKGLHEPSFFSPFFNTWTFMCPYFFLIAHASLLFLTKTGERERPTHIVEHLFCGMSGWYNADFSKKYSKGVYGVHVNLDHESMKRIRPRVTTIWQSSMQKQGSYKYKVFQDNSSFGFGRT